MRRASEGGKPKDRPDPSARSSPPLGPDRVPHRSRRVGLWRKERATPVDPRGRAPRVGRRLIRVLAATDVADDALASDDLASILEDGGYASGAERTFGGGGDIRSVTVRVLSFGSASGAETYVEWLDGHAEEILGPIDRSTTIGVAGMRWPLYGHLPRGCCAKEVPVYLTAWSEGAQVVTVLVLGPAADERAVAALAEQIHRAMGWIEDDA